MNSILLKVVIIFSLLIPGIKALAQVYVGSVNINEQPKVKVAEVLVEGRFQSESVNVSVDYGQGGKAKDQQIIDPGTRKKKEFASTSDLINFMENNNWEHYDSQIITKGSNVMYYYYFRKK